jgi:serine/threonine protein kinase
VLLSPDSGSNSLSEPCGPFEEHAQPLMATPNKTKIPVGFVLSDKYRITREIGRGGMAAVYEAENVDIGKRVAIKVLAQELTSSTIVVERFLREARAAAAIRSPYICDIYDSGRLDDGRPFLVLELLEGDSLYERMTKVRIIDVETTLTVMTQTCRGLTKAHSANIVHRDLKPENIFITKDEEGRLLAKILDFGLAKFYAPMETGSGPQARLTREGAVFGTPAYMSPEQVRGQGAVDHRADLWALGCIVYECFTGRTVWSTEQGVAMTFAQIANAPLPRPAEYRPDLPPSFTKWFDKALNRNIAERFQTAKEFAGELNAAFQQGSPSFSAIHDVKEMLASAGRSSAATGPYSDPGIPPDSAPHSTPSGGVMGKLPDGAASDPRGSRAHFAAPGAEAAPAAHAKSSGSGSRFVVVVSAMGLLAGAGYVGYRQFVQRGQAPIPTTSAPTTSASAPPVASSASTPMPVDPDAPVGAPWRPIVAKGQKLLAEGKTDEALKAFKEAFDMGGHGVPRTLLEHLGQAMAADNKDAPCKLTGLARPRAYDLRDERVRVVAAGQPGIGVGPQGPLLTWTDGREGGGAQHAFAVTLDGALRPQGEAVDVTPEGLAIGVPTLHRAGDRFILSYWDAKGPEAGVHVRWLDANGRIAGPAVPVGDEDRTGFWPTVATSSDSVFVIWSKQTDANVEDLFLRKLDHELAPQGDVVRLTEFLPHTPSKSRARYPSAEVTSDALHVVFRLERDPNRLIHHLRIPLKDLAAGGLSPRTADTPKEDRFVGELEVVNNDKAQADAPSIACGKDACFVAWHGEVQGGAYAAYLEPNELKPIWRKKFTSTGSRPTAAMSDDGRAQLFWYDRGRVKTAAVTRDGVGNESTVARISGDQPAPSVSAGSKPGEWYVAWLDYETGHLEPYAARVQCE